MGTLSATPQFHTVLNQEIEHMGGLVLPVLYLNTEEGIKKMDSLLGYLISNSDKSLTWHRTRSRAMGLFYDFCQSPINRTCLRGENPYRAIIRRFARSLRLGTINVTTGEDPSRLYWPPGSYKVTKRLCSALIEFTRYIQDEGIASSELFNAINSPIPNNEPAALKFLHTAFIIKRLSFFSHVINANNLANRLQDRSRNSIVNLGASTYTNHDESEGLRFPSDLIAPLFEYGFVLDKTSKVPHEREDITAKMMTLLLFFGGTRKSEPLHLWFNDVLPDYSEDGLCKVFLREPSDSKTYIAGEDKLRSQYLAEKGLRPRNNKGNTKSYYAGWKNLATDKALNASVFFVHSNAQYLFNHMYIYYTNTYRPPLIEINRNLGKPDHPFLLVSNGIDQATKESYEGSPYSMSAFDDAFTRALDRVEKALDIVIPRGKEYGTTLHGGRHFYGGTLADVGIKEKVIQKCLRQRSITSQGTYTTPTFERIQTSLNNAKNDIDSAMPSLLKI